MPSSDPETIPAVVGLLMRLAPKDVLDIGAGYGKYGALFREYLEMVHTQSSQPRLPGSTMWQKRLVRLDAVEGFSDYVGKLHYAVYDNVFIENIFDFIKRQWEYDLIFMGDMLEHVEKEPAINELIPALLPRAKIGVVISVPACVAAQGAEFGNEMEVHRSRWDCADFHGMAPFDYTGRKGNQIISFLTRDLQYYQIARENALRRKLRAIRRAVRDAW